MEKLKSDIEIIDWLNSLKWIGEVRVSSFEIVGKIEKDPVDKQDIDLIHACIDNKYYILMNCRLICIKRFNK